MAGNGSNGADWVRLSEAAQLLGVSPVTVRRWADAGRIACTRTPGGQRRFHRCELEALVGADPSDAAGLSSPAGPILVATPAPDLANMFAALRQASRAITSSVVLEDVLDIVARTAAAALDGSACTIFAYDAATDTLAARAICETRPSGYAEELGEAFPASDYPHVRELLGSPDVVVEYISDAGLPADVRASMEEYGEMSCLTVPLRLGGEALGFLVLTETGRERHFTSAELELAAALGEQAAIAMHNATMFRRQEEQTARLASLLESSRAVATTACLEDALAIVAQRACEALGSPQIVIYEHDVDANATVALALFESEPTGWEGLGRRFSLEDWPVDRRILRDGKALVEHISDPRLDPASRAAMVAWGEKTMLTVPLRFGDESVGLLVVFETEVERVYTAEEMAVVDGLAEQAAVAIHTDQMLRRLGKQNRHLASLLRASRASASTLVLDDVLEAVGQSAVDTLGMRECVIWEFHPDQDILQELSAVSEAGYQVTGEVWQMSEHPSENAILHGDVPVVETISDPGLDPVARASMERWGEKTCLSMPLAVGGQRLGLLVLIEDREERTFTAEELGLAQALGEQAAIAINNAKLYRAQEERNRHLLSLLDAGRALTSTVRIDEVLGIVAETAAQALDCPECVIFEHDREADTITARSFYSIAPSGYDELGVPLELDDFPDDRLILEGHDIVVESLSDPDLAPSVRESLEAYGEKTSVSVPLRFRDEPVGILVLNETASERRFSDAEIELLRGIGEQAAAAIHNARLFASLELSTRETGLLNEIARKATASLNVVEVARATVDEIRRLMQFDVASLAIADGDGLLGSVFASTGREAMLSGAALAELPLGVRTRLVEGHAAVLDLPQDPPLPGAPAAFEGLRSAALVALLRDEEVTGVLALGSTRDRAFSAGDGRFLEALAAHLSLAINNAGLFENVKLMHLGNLRALSSALNAKDYYTFGHTARVAAYAVLLARELGWSRELIGQVEEIAFLHDIGKIAVSDRSLLKPGPLSNEEWELMREHPVISAEIIEPLLGEHLVAGVRHHHERYDGTGYPDGLAAEGISQIARLLCVVDSYDAMSSLRLYRQALTYPACVKELEDGRGTQFDPQMVDAFLRVLEELRELKAEALVAAWEAAAEIDGGRFAELAASVERDEPARAALGAQFDQTMALRPRVSGMVAESRLDEHRSAVVVSRSNDPEAADRLGEVVLADQEEMEAYAGRPIDANVLFVDEYGAWVCGLAPILDGDGGIVGLVRTVISAIDLSGAAKTTSDVTRMFTGLARDAASRLTRVEIDSMTDGLTGLYNHRYLHERLSEEVSRALAQGTELSVLFCDVDQFKEANDRLGHRGGDDVLRRMAQVVGRTIRRIDLAARYGGDEFAVVLIETGPVMAFEVAERIRTAISEAPLAPGGRVTVSIGLATLPGDAQTKTELLDKADWAMYVAKRRGRDRCVAFAGAGEQTGR